MHVPDLCSEARPLCATTSLKEHGYHDPRNGQGTQRRLVGLLTVGWICKYQGYLGSLCCIYHIEFSKWVYTSWNPWLLLGWLQNLAEHMRSIGGIFKKKTMLGMLCTWILHDPHFSLSSSPMAQMDSCQFLSQDPLKSSLITCVIALSCESSCVHDEQMSGRSLFDCGSVFRRRSERLGPTC